ncbi:hypothetical protein D3C85_767120 [compost metagenome]
MTPVHDTTSDIAERMSTALAKDGPRAALICLKENLERTQMMDSVAVAVGLTPKKVASLLSGKPSPPFLTVAALCRAAGLRFVCEVAPKPED